MPGRRLRRRQGGDLGDAGEVIHKCITQRESKLLGVRERCYMPLFTCQPNDRPAPNLKLLPPSGVNRQRNINLCLLCAVQLCGGQIHPQAVSGQQVCLHLDFGLQEDREEKVGEGEVGIRFENVYAGQPANPGHEEAKYGRKGRTNS